jgi:glycosyltransferase involved in cell wall biosynthesis
MRVETAAMGFVHAREREPELLRDWSMLVFGEGPNAPKIAEIAARHPAIRLVGHVPHGDLARTLLTASALVSIPESDASSASLLEGMAAGLTPVVNDLPANRQWVDSSTGEIVPKDPSVVDVANAIVRVARQPKEASEIRAKVASATWELQIEKLGEAFRQLQRSRPA